MPKTSGVPTDDTPSLTDFLLGYGPTSGLTEKQTIENVLALIFSSAGGSTGASWSTWTPTWTNLTVGNGVASGRYTQIGKTIFATLSFTLGTTSAVGTQPTFSLPVSSISYSKPPAIGVTYIEDAGVNAIYGHVQWFSTTSARIRSLNAAGTFVVDGGITSTIPFTWGTSDFFSLSMFYEAA